MMRRVAQSYGRNFLLIELLTSMAAAAGGALGAEFLWGRESLLVLLDGNRQLLYETVSKLAGALLGFAITSMSVLFGLTQSDRYALLRRSPYYRQVYAIYLNTAFYLGTATVLGLVGLFADHGQPALVWFPYVFGWAPLICVLRVWRCVWVLWRIIKIAVA